MRSFDLSIDLIGLNVIPVSTQPLKEISSRNLPLGKGRQALKADDLTAIGEAIV
jgi:hypothetical protein